MGSQSRSRMILSPSRTTSYSCPTLADSTSCDAGAGPPPDQVLGCLVTNWQGWSECSVTCGGSIYTRSRTVTRPAINGGTACPTTFETSVCSPTECPVDCQVASWTIWGSCSYAQSALRFSWSLPSHTILLYYLDPRMVLSRFDLCPSSSCGDGSISRSRAIARSVGGGGQTYACISFSCTEASFLHREADELALGIFYLCVQVSTALRDPNMFEHGLPCRLCHNQLDSVDCLPTNLWQCE